MVTTYFKMICMCLMTLNCTGPGMHPPCSLLKLNMFNSVYFLNAVGLQLCSPQVILYVSIYRLPLSERHSLLLEQLQNSPGQLQVINLPLFFDLLIVLIDFAVSKERTHSLVIVTILIMSTRFNQHQNRLAWHLSALEKLPGIGGLMF